MENFFTNYQNELLTTLVCIIIVLISRTLALKTIRRIGRISNLNQARTRLISKYILIMHSVLLIVALVFIWGINIKDLGLIFSSVFAVIGVALFATWSILSNVTAGIILFFSFPYKIGDRIRIHDKELEEKTDYTIEDIRGFHVHLRKSTGELITYPNNLFLQKAVTQLPPEIDSEF